MEKPKLRKNRVLGRQLAKVLTLEELRAAAGQGTSFAGTQCDASGKAGDLDARDCCDGPDRFAC